jgi:hypothetical protein
MWMLQGVQQHMDATAMTTPTKPNVAQMDGDDWIN